MDEVVWLQKKIEQLQEEIWTCDRISADWSERVEDCRVHWTDEAGQAVFRRNLFPTLQEADEFMNSLRGHHDLLSHVNQIHQGMVADLDEIARLTEDFGQGVARAERDLERANHYLVEAHSVGDDALKSISMGELVPKVS